MQEQVIVQEVPDAPQVVGSSPPLVDFAVQPYVPFHAFQVAERTQEQIVEAIDEEIRCGVPAVFQAASPVVEHRAPAPGVRAPTLVDENTAHAPAVLHSPTPVVESVAPAPALSEALAPGVEHISPAPAGLFPVPMVANIATVPSVSHSPAPVVEHFSPAPAVLPRGDEVTLLFRKTTECRPQLRVHARRTRPLHFAFKAYCRRFGLQESQVRFSCDGLLSPDHSPDQLGLEDGDVIEAEEVYVEDEEEEDDDDYDEFDGTESRFPAGFRPMRMCRWFPSGNCRQGLGCMFAHSVSELHPLARGQGP